MKSNRLILAPATDYSRLQQLCAPLDMCLAVTAILAGETPALVYVDDLMTPTVALLFPWQGDRVYLAGEAHHEDIIEQIKETLFAHFTPLKKPGKPYGFLIYYSSSSWEPHFPRMCAGMETISAKRQYYVLEQDPPHWRDGLAESWQLRPVTGDLLAEPQLQHLPELIHEMHSESPSPEEFLAHKFGYCMQEDQALMGWCLSEYNHADRCEVGIETLPDYRRRGIGFTLASALIAHALNHGVTKIGWHCWKNNQASSVLALKLGGALEAEYAVQLCRLPA